MIIIILFLIPYSLESQIIINEFMPYPHAGIPEWIELHNQDTINTFTAEFLWIEDAVNAARVEQVVIPPNGYLILTRDTSALQKVIGNIPSPMRHISLPTLNNTTDKIKIRNQDWMLIDSISYSFKREHRNMSLERMQGLPISFQISEDIRGHSCGYINSCIPLNEDVKVHDIYGTQDSLFVIIHNNGNTIMNMIILEIKMGISSIQSSIDMLQPNEYGIITFSFRDINCSFGMNHFSITSSHAKVDPRTYNNNGVFEYYRSYPEKSIVINEVNVTDNVYPEFVELAIKNHDIVLLDGYRCIIGTDTIPLLSSDTSEYIVLTKKYDERLSNTSSLFYFQSFQLSDQGMMIKVLDPNDICLDSLDYTVLIERFNAYINSTSFEYVDSLLDGNWFMSMNNKGGSPGAMNSHIQSPSFAEIDIELKDCDGKYMDCKSAHINHPFTIGIYSCDLYSIDGYFIQRIINDKLISAVADISLHELSWIASSAYILRHNVKDFYGSQSVSKLTTYIKRN
jgi:hypothetical protein